MWTLHVLVKFHLILEIRIFKLPSSYRRKDVVIAHTEFARLQLRVNSCHCLCLFQQLDDAFTEKIIYVCFTELASNVTAYILIFLYDREFPTPKSTFPKSSFTFLMSILRQGATNLRTIYVSCWKIHHLSNQKEKLAHTPRVPSDIFMVGEHVHRCEEDSYIF